LAAHVTSIVNASLHVPDRWKISRITAVPKLFPSKHVESDVRPIAVTNAIAKIAQKFVSRYFRDSMTITQTLICLDVFMVVLLLMLC